ncbi:hypothetical protein F0L68_14640 [Solihabitans fulvus]|uniref:Uncharacterized protein n=1 Tax=Solihabitans fulvus TaxID=1892852 RepID=A0A5B2XGC3_9PSEU|nr:hypothetical protein F0L68_14640 [Solihabitans fulvus]
MRRGAPAVSTAPTAPGSTLPVRAAVGPPATGATERAPPPDRRGDQPDPGPDPPSCSPDLYAGRSGPHSRMIPPLT